MVASPEPNNTVETISPAAACPVGTHMAGMYSMGTPTIPEAVRNCWRNVTKKLDKKFLRVLAHRNITPRVCNDVQHTIINTDSEPANRCLIHKC